MNTRFRPKLKEIPLFKVDIMKSYLIQFVLRVAVLIFVFWGYLVHPHYFDFLVTKNMELQIELNGLSVEQFKETLASQYSIWWLYVIWAIFMVNMIAQMFPQSIRITMGARKVFLDHYYPVENPDRLGMYQHIQRQNLGALETLVAWLILNGIFGALYVFGIIGVKELVLLTAIYYVCDLVCVIFFCPFQTYFMKNRCCVNCRIFNWGYFMIFTPMVFIRTFITWSLFFVAVFLLLRWEVTLIVHPERFWDGTNHILKCENCQDKICQIKKPYYPRKKDRFSLHDVPEVIVKKLEGEIPEELVMVHASDSNPEKDAPVNDTKN